MFANYSEFLTSNRENCFEPFLFGTWLERKVVSFDDSSESVRGLSACINLAAACAVFGGWTLPIDSLERSRLRATVDESINLAKEQHQNAAAVLAAKLNSGDASRVIHMLKLLGWIDPDLTASAQLSLGASGGTKDRHAIATFPVRRCSLSRHDSIAKGYGYI